MIAKSDESRFVAEHEFMCGHLNQGLSIRLTDQCVEAPSGYIRGIFHHICDALQ